MTKKTVVDGPVHEITTYPIAATEFALVLGEEKTLVQRVTLRTLGFPQGGPREEIYRAAYFRGYGFMDPYVAVRVMSMLKQEDGIVHIASGYGQLKSGKHSYGFLVTWPEGRILGEEDIARPDEYVPPDHSFFFAVRRKTKHLTS